MRQPKENTIIWQMSVFYFNEMNNVTYISFLDSTIAEIILIFACI